MAPNVPYNPTPQVNQQQIGQPGVHVDSPLAAFGGATAEALQGLGQTVSGAGNELFARAVALKQLDNETEARNADADYMINAGKLHADYSALQGKAAVDAYPKYVSDLEDLRRKSRDGLSNPMAQRMFDSTSISTMGRTIFNGAGHAAAENKSYLIGSAKSRIEANADNALAMPADEKSFQQSVLKTQQDVQALADLHGWSDDQRNQELASRTSDLWMKRIEGLARTSPFAADKMLKQALADGSIRGEKQEALINFVRTQTHAVGARNISHTVNTGSDLHWGSQIVTDQQAKDAIGGFESGNNYSKLGPQTPHGRALGKYQVMEEYLPDYLKRAGLPSMTPQEFLANHDAQEQVFQAAFVGDMKKYGSFNEAASRWLTGKGVAEAQASGVRDVNGTDVNAYLANTNAILARGVPLSDKVARAAELSKSQAPDDPLMEDYARARVETDNAQMHRIKLTQDFENRQVIESGLMGGKDGKLPTNIDELKASVPGADEAWSHLDPSVQRRYLGVLAKNSKGDVAWTKDGLNRYQTLRGMAQADPADFLNTSVIDEDKLPFSARRELITLQNRLKANAEGDPRVTKAMGILAPDLNAAGITRQDKDRYYQYTGALQDALESFAQENKRPPKADEIQQIGRRLLQTNIPGWFSDTLNFEVPVPSEEAEKIKASPEWKQLGITPTDQQIQRIYARQTYQKLYGGTAKKSENEAGPQVPISR